jgi:hypothetical protein
MEEGDSTITCVRCRLMVFIALEEGGLRLKYDFDRWRKGCCCAHPVGPSGVFFLRGTARASQCATALPRPGLIGKL